MTPDGQIAIPLDTAAIREPVMGMVPVGAGVGGHEVILKALSRRDRILRQARHAIHGVLNANAMPVNRGRRRQVIDDPPGYPSPLCNSDFRAGGVPFEAPYRCLFILLRQQLEIGDAGSQRHQCRLCGQGLRQHRQTGGTHFEKVTFCQAHVGTVRTEVKMAVANRMTPMQSHSKEIDFDSCGPTPGSPR